MEGCKLFFLVNRGKKLVVILEINSFKGRRVYISWDCSLVVLFRWF